MIIVYDIPVPNGPAPGAPRATLRAGKVYCGHCGHASCLMSISSVSSACVECPGGECNTDRPPAAAPVERCHHGYATAVCGPCYRGEDGPPAEWLAVWASGYLGGYATGYDHGHEDGDREHGERLAEALNPMRRAAAHGIDVALARGAWQQHQRRMGGGS